MKYTEDAENKLTDQPAAPFKGAAFLRNMTIMSRAFVANLLVLCSDIAHFHFNKNNGFFSQTAVYRQLSYFTPFCPDMQVKDYFKVILSIFLYFVYKKCGNNMCIIHTRNI